MIFLRPGMVPGKFAGLGAVWVFRPQGFAPAGPRDTAGGRHSLKAGAMVAFRGQNAEAGLDPRGRGGGCRRRTLG